MTIQTIIAHWEKQIVYTSASEGETRYTRVKDEVIKNKN